MSPSKPRLLPTNRLVAWATDIMGTITGMAILFAGWLAVGDDLIARHTADRTVATFLNAVPITSPHHPHQGQDRRLTVPDGVLGLLWVPAFARPMPIRDGVDLATLRHGTVGHYPFTTKLGEPGNSGLAAHRRGAGSSFFHIDQLQPGDPIVIQTADGWLVYTVVGHEIVSPDEGQVLWPVPRSPHKVPSGSMVTLTSCHSLTKGAYGNSHRWVVYARLTANVAGVDQVPESVRQMVKEV